MNLSHHLLLAMPSLKDSGFSESLIYLFEHTENGAMGFIINRKLLLEVDEVLEQVNITPNPHLLVHCGIFSGGPVEPERGFVVHTCGRKWETTMDNQHNIGVTSSKDILESIAIGEGPDDVFIALGYAGWEAGQLEQEMSENCWLSCPANEQILFHTHPDERLKATAALLGIDLNQLSSDIGHA